MCAKGRKQYFKKMFGKDSPTDGKALPEQKNALAKAHDIRKFEIELYWKRATYFWAFQVAIFAGLTASLAKDFQLAFLTPVFTLIGVVTSLAWHYVNKGSKFWQENWELHIDLLEKECTGNLYKSVLCYAEDKNDAYSVSRINLTTSLVFVGVWSFLFVWFIIPHEYIENLLIIFQQLSCWGLILLVFLIVILILFLCCLPRYWRTNFGHSTDVELFFYRNRKIILRSREEDRVNNSNNDSNKQQ